MSKVRSVGFCSELEASRMAACPRTAMISITNPGEVAGIQEGWGALLRIAFADTSYDEHTIEFWGRSWRASSRGNPTKEHALAIRRFLAELPPAIENVQIHCGAGVSRSAAVAKYAAGFFGVPFDANYTRFNAVVYRLLQTPDCFDAILAKLAPPPATSPLKALLGMVGRWLAPR